MMVLQMLPHVQTIKKKQFVIGKEKCCDDKVSDVLQKVFYNDGISNVITCAPNIRNKNLS